MNYQGYRNMLVEEKNSELTEAVESEDSEISFDPGDMTEEEIEYVERQVERRTGCCLRRR